MNVGSELIPRESFKRQWFRTPDLVDRSESEYSIIFISNTRSAFSKNFIGDWCVTATLSEAKQQVLASDDHSHKIIVIDIELAIAKLEVFASTARKKANTIIIYNERKLTKNESKFLKAFELVDEVIDLEVNNFDFVVAKAIESKNRTSKSGVFLKAKELGRSGKTKAKDASFFFKKLFDIFIAATLILLLFPLFVLIAIVIKCDSKGPLFYSSLRAGRGYKIFKFYKFRTMVKDADKKIKELAHLNQYDLSTNGPAFFKINDDPRVTRVGKFLRNSSLDELPQLFNILLGDMSIVGNRPLPLYEAATLTTNEFVERFSAPAGMTGFWQIKKRGKAEMSVKERVDLDIIYARRASPLFDLYIMAKTPAALFQKSHV